MATINRIAFAIVVSVFMSGCQSATKSNGRTTSQKPQVVVMGTIYEEHLRSQRYSTKDVADYIRRIRPEVVICEIPPDRVQPALRDFQSHGQLQDSYFDKFPEYYGALFPIQQELGFDIVGCSAWTSDLDELRERRMAEVEMNRPADYSAYRNAVELATSAMQREAIFDDPIGIHSVRYDQIAEQGVSPYASLFSATLGPAGWDALNERSLSLMNDELDRHRGSGKRILIMYGAGHKHWFQKRLAMRKDIELIPFTEAIYSSRDIGQ